MNIWAAILSVLMVWWWHSGQAAAQDDRPLNVLTLNGGDPYLPAFVALEQAVREEILSRSPRPVEFYTEMMDMLRHPAGAFEKETLNLLARKYPDTRIDAVVAIAPVALNFAERYRERLWPNAVIVFHSVPGHALDTRRVGPGTTGIPVRYHFRETAELALRVRPDTRRLVVVAGVGSYDRLVTESARRALAPLSGRLEIDYLVGLPLDELVDEVSSLEAGTLVLYLLMFRDRNDRAYTPQKALKEIAAASSVPVFGSIETYLGAGIVGGWIEPYADQGRRVGQLVLASAGQGSSADLGVQPPIAPKCIADWQQLGRWDIDEELLPRDCDVRFRELTAWDQYRWQIAGGIGIITLQALLIGGLLTQRRRRLRAELAAQQHRVELTHAARLSTVGELSATIAHEINQPLGAILTNADAAELLLESGKAEPGQIRQIIADIRRDDLRASDVVGRLRTLLARKEMSQEPLRMNTAINDVVAFVQTEARRRRCRIESRLSDSLPEVNGDRIHLQQVILNLIINAMDAMADVPEISRRVVVTSQLGEDGVEVGVSDHGDGIPADEIPYLFQSFYTTKPQGLGLGLSIARTIVEAHGGRIWAERNDRVGMTFRFSLPAGLAKSMADQPAPAAAPA